MHFRSMERMLVLTAIFLAVALALTRADAQSIWKKMKQQIQDAQQKQQGHQKPPQQQQSQSQRSAQQASAQGDPRSGPIVPPAGTKVEEQMMAPLQQGAQFYVSPHGVHVATVENAGSRAVVYYDGVEGPKFDKILWADSNAAIAFSPDGKRYAYCAASGSEVVAMVDGKELARTSEPAASAAAESLCDKLGFTSNSRHVYYLSRVWPANGNPYTRFVFDGMASPPSGWAQAAPAPSFSSDGNHYSYIWNDPNKQKSRALIIDGKPAPYRGGDPQWSADSQHLYTTLAVPMAGRGEIKEALLDGKPFMRANDIELFIPPVGDMVVAKLTVGGGAQGQQQFLVIDGKKVAGSEIAFGQGGYIDMISISPDGKHYAARVTAAYNRKYVFADGKRGQEYESVDNIAFTADSSKVTYTARANSKQYVVYGDQESNPCQPLAATIRGSDISPVNAPVIAPVGNRAGTICGKMGDPLALFMDGKTLPIIGIAANDLRFSPDGQHYVYTATLQSHALHLVMDGLEQQTATLPFANNAFGKEYVFSRDSKHIAVYASPPTPSSDYSRGLLVDGKYVSIGLVGPPPNLLKLDFTPDGKHIIWAAPLHGGQDFRVLVDGKLVVETGSAVATDSRDVWWEMTPDGTLNLLGEDDTSLKRISITPSPSTSVEALLAGAH